MSYLALAVCCAIVAFSLATAVGSGVVASLHAGLGARIDRMPARRRASVYLCLRLAPTVFGLAFVGLFFLPAFFKFEPADSGEQVTGALIGVTLIAAIPLAGCARATIRGWRSTRARAAQWLADARPLRLADRPSLPAFAVHAPFPVVAVVGVRRPYLVVSRAVLDACSDDELAAILAHEATHVLHRDNLKRLLMLVTPDLLTGTATARDLELGWQQASEEIADDGAGSRRSLDLAAALVKVARLTQGLPAPPTTMAAFCRDDEIVRRVTRLTGARPQRRADRRGAWLAGWTLASVAIMALAANTLPRVHAVTELLVGLLQ